MRRISAIDKMLGPLFMGTKPEKKYKAKKHAFKFDHGIVNFKRSKNWTDVWTEPDDGYKWTGIGFEKIGEPVEGSIFIAASNYYQTSLGIMQFINEMKQYGGKAIK
jgi:hypothetical protein